MRPLALAAAALTLGGLSLTAGAPTPAPAQAVGSGKGGVTLTRVGSFRAPTFLAQPRGERRHLYVTEQRGTIKVIRAGRTLRRSFVDLRSKVSEGPERGLLSVAFPPDHRRTRKLYVNYTDNRGDTRIAELKVSKRSRARAVRSSLRTILRIRQPASNHNGGQLAFGPDGYLYVGMGDGGGANDRFNHAQRRRTLLGAILRIDPSRRTRTRRYGIPRGNPFRGRPGRSEIWAYGLRNPWRFSFDRRTGNALIADVGQDRFEEVNYVSRRRGNGANFGWPAYEGRARLRRDKRVRRHVRPIHVYSHRAASGAHAPGEHREATGGCSITGGYVVRDRELPTLYGRYVYGDFCRGWLRSFVPRSRGARGDHPLRLNVPRLTSFGEDSRGRVYALSGAGPVYRLGRR